MSFAVWTLLYAVADAERERYLEWFHDVHIPDKLARPGYTWAAHYAEALDGPAGMTGYMAFFGGEATRVFYDPSPAQLKTRQDALTREMMGLRINNTGIVCGKDGCLGAAKWLSSSSAPRHAMVQSFESLAACDAANRADQSSEWSGVVAGRVSQPLGPPRVGKRIWPKL